MNNALRTLAIIGSILLLGGLATAAHYQDKHSNLEAELMLGESHPQELSVAKNMFRTMTDCLHYSANAKRVALVGGMLMAYSLLSLQFIQDRRIRKIENANNRLQAIDAKASQPDP